PRPRPPAPPAGVTDAPSPEQPVAANNAQPAIAPATQERKRGNPFMMLFKSQCVDGIERSRLSRRIESEEYANRRGKAECNRDAVGRRGGRPALPVGDSLGQSDAERDADAAADQAQDHGLDQELEE